MKRAFSLVEMLVVMGILAILIAATVGAYGPVTRQAQKARGQELVSNVRDALEFVLQKENEWPIAIRREGKKPEGLVTAEVCASLVKHGAMTLDYKARTADDGSTVYDMQGVYRMGLLSPWAEALVRQRLGGGGGTVGDSVRLASGGTVGDHRLRFAVDTDYDGRVQVGVSASGKRQNTTVRATACVWCCGYDGEFGTRDDIYSWGKGQEE